MTENPSPTDLSREIDRLVLELEASTDAETAAALRQQLRELEEQIP